MQAITVDVATTALLVLDYQEEILGSLPPQVADQRLDVVAALLDAARSISMTVVHVVVRYRPGYPEASPYNKRVSMIASNERLREGSEQAEIHERVAPARGEPVVVKRRVSAFAHTDLMPLLRAARVQTLILAGISTTGVVTSTLRQASDEDFRILVIEDGCADPNEEAHRVLMEQVFPLHADVLSGFDIIGALKRA